MPPIVVHQEFTHASTQTWLPCSAVVVQMESTDIGGRAGHVEAEANETWSFGPASRAVFGCWSGMSANLHADTSLDTVVQARLCVARSSAPVEFSKKQVRTFFVNTNCASLEH